LIESAKHANNLERANGTHLQKFADISRKNEALEKVSPLVSAYILTHPDPPCATPSRPLTTYTDSSQRYTQVLHTQTLTQQSLTHVRSELTALRATSTRQHIALASGVGVEERLADVEKRYEEAMENAEGEARKARDEERRRKRAEERIGGCFV
jgi:hypothetical protein